MKKRPAHVVVKARECRGDAQRMIRKFIKKVKKAKIVELVRDKQRYKKPSVAKKEKRIRAERQRRRQERKRIRAQERRNRTI